MRNLARKGLTAITISAATVLVMAGGAAASPFDPSGVIRLAKPANEHLNATQSGNWFGYNAGALERGALFNSISADWAVPAASSHAAGQNEASATWIGIGGGCLEPGCGLSDTTLIQAGTEQDVDSSGRPSYSAWWELVPAPAVTISNVKVSPGDHIQVSIAEAVPNSEVWTITLRDTSNGETFTTTVPYSSTHSTAEWIEETPLSFGSNGVGETALPQLAPTQFSGATVNGSPAHLSTAEEVQLVDSAGAVIGTPSSPDGSATAFTACAWASACSAPSFNGPIAPATGTARRFTSRHRRPRRHPHKARHRRHRTHHARRHKRHKA